LKKKHLWSVCGNAVSMKAGCLLIELGRIATPWSAVDLTAAEGSPPSSPPRPPRSRASTPSPGVARTAETIVTELGCDMSRLPTAGYAASWAGLCPGNRESAGKRLSGRTRFANRILRQALMESARGAVCTRDCHLAAQYRRLVRRRGDKKAVVAVAHSILVAYHLLPTVSRIARG
jgi:hypothetical protein